MDNARRHNRMRTTSIRIMMDGTFYDILDISVSGFLIQNAPDWMATGQGLSFHFVVDVNGEDTYIATNGSVIRNTADGLAVEYEAPHPKWERILPTHLASHG